jgi:hypothetical protein
MFSLMSYQVPTITLTMFVVISTRVAIINCYAISFIIKLQLSRLRLISNDVDTPLISDRLSSILRAV